MVPTAYGPTADVDGSVDLKSWLFGAMYLANPASALSATSCSSSGCSFAPDCDANPCTIEADVPRDKSPRAWWCKDSHSYCPPKPVIGVPVCSPAAQRNAPAGTPCPLGACDGLGRCARRPEAEWRRYPLVDGRVVVPEHSAVAISSLAASIDRAGSLAPDCDLVVFYGAGKFAVTSLTSDNAFATVVPMRDAAGAAAPARVSLVRALCHGPQTDGATLVINGSRSCSADRDCAAMSGDGSAICVAGECELEADLPVPAVGTRLLARALVKSATPVCRSECVLNAACAGDGTVAIDTRLARGLAAAAPECAACGACLMCRYAELYGTNLAGSGAATCLYSTKAYCATQVSGLGRCVVDVACDSETAACAPVKRNCTDCNPCTKNERCELDYRGRPFCAFDVAAGSNPTSQWSDTPVQCKTRYPYVAYAGDYDALEGSACYDQMLSPLVNAVNLLAGTTKYATKCHSLSCSIYSM
jgi:hypothetical protein